MDFRVISQARRPATNARVRRYSTEPCHSLLECTTVDRPIYIFLTLPSFLSLSIPRPPSLPCVSMKRNDWKKTKGSHFSEGKKKKWLEYIYISKKSIFQFCVLRSDFRFAPGLAPADLHHRRDSANHTLIIPKHEINDFKILRPKGENAGKKDTVE